MRQLEAVIHNVVGLHARPARVLVDTAKKYQASISLQHGSKLVDAKSLISVLTLGVRTGQKIQFQISGVDEDAAATDLTLAIAEGLGEGPPNAEISPTARQEKENIRQDTTSALLQSELPAHVIRGVAGAPGIIVGPVYRYVRPEITVQAEHTAGVEQEQLRLQKALATAREQLTALETKLLAQDKLTEAAILEVQHGILNDLTLIGTVQKAITTGYGAAEAWQTVVSEQAQLMAKLADSILAERAADLWDIHERVLALLTGVSERQALELETPAIIIAHDLTPSETASLDPTKVLGFCTAVGGSQAHTAIIARALGLPSVVGAGLDILEVSSGTQVVLDGNQGLLIVDPNELIVEKAQTLRLRELAQKEALLQDAAMSATTVDGHRVEIAANIGSLADAQQAVKFGAEGVGLFRTEFLFLNRVVAPTEEEQFQIYRAVAEAIQNQPIIIRTLDIGGDKPIPYLNLPVEANPFLGQRGIRLCLAYPELFKQQLRAILRAAAATTGKLRIMFPMVSDLAELLAAKALVEEVRSELGVASVEIGIMVEVPAAALNADSLLAEIDFFSIGTNDLTQYTLALDRTHPLLAKHADGLHPAVLRLIAHVVKVAHAANKWVGVCGELGMDTQAVPILVGLGVDELSVSTPAIPAVKAQIRGLTLEYCHKRAQQALSCATAAEVRKRGEEL
jgi:phosphocarrier protein FPr